MPERAARVVRDNAELRAEVRYRYEPTEPIPEGWRFVRNEFDHQKDPKRPYWALYNDGGILKWVELQRITQRRFVTEWEDA